MQDMTAMEDLIRQHDLQWRAEMIMHSTQLADEWTWDDVTRTFSVNEKAFFHKHFT